MSTEKAQKQKAPRCLVVGKGRIGLPLITRLKQSGYDCHSIRLDSQTGIGRQYFENLEKSENSEPTILVICISAVGKSWTWDNILEGLLIQIRNKEIYLKQIILVSSTRVYEGFNKGLVTALSPTAAESEKAKQIIAAETELLKSHVDSWIIRCSGLYGNDYPKYTPIMLAAKGKPRAGVQTGQVVQTIFDLINDYQENGSKNGVQVLTDGYCYFEGKKYRQTSQEIKEISKGHKVLFASSDIRDDK